MSRQVENAKPLESHQDPVESMAGSIWHGIAQETTERPGHTTSAAVGGAAFGLLNKSVFLKNPRTELIVGAAAAAGFVGYELWKHGGQLTHALAVEIAPQRYSSAERLQASKSLETLGAGSTDAAVAALGYLGGRSITKSAVAWKAARANVLVTNESRLITEDVSLAAKNSDFLSVPEPAHVLGSSEKTVYPTAREVLDKPAALKAEHDVAEFKPTFKRVDFNSPREAAIRNLVQDQTGFSVLGRMERGTNGAYLVEDHQGLPHIFKLVSRDDVTPQISMSARAAAAVDSLAARTPQYERVQFTAPHGSWYMQEVLPGIPSPYPSDKLIGQMVELNGRQAGKAFDGLTNWNNKILSAIHHDSLGWKRTISSASPEGADLVRRVDRILGRLSTRELRESDIVHGDFQHYNALVSSTDRLTGYVDWEGAGKGDRSIDLARMLYDSYVAEEELGYRANPETLAMLAGKVKETSGVSSLQANMSYWVLQVADFGAKCGQSHLSKFAKVGRRILTDMETTSVRAAS